MNNIEHNNNTVLFIGSDIIGRGENITLGHLLMQNFIHTLNGLPNGPQAILLMNNGVKLIIADSPVIGEFKQLESRGVEILACTTCLEYFDLVDKLSVGRPTTMAKSIEAMLDGEFITL